VAEARRCAICGRVFRPKPRSRKYQKYCSRPCAKHAKRQRDRLHKQRYRETGLGREQRHRENERYRNDVGWAEYMRYWRKADARRTARQERQRAGRYYQRHREQIQAKRREQRAAQKALGKARSH
jgi:hypothetical protein